MVTSIQTDFDEYVAVHPHWRGHLLLSRINNQLVHKETQSTGIYERNNDILSVKWDKFPPETFVLQSGSFIKIETLDHSSRASAERIIERHNIMSHNTPTVSVLTDTVSADFYFPLWHKYYGDQFGADNLHVISFGGEENSFHDFEFGSLESMPEFNNIDRARHITNKCKELLQISDLVIRCDVDEFLLPDPRKYENLKHYISELQAPYVTAYGYNVFQVEAEPPLDFGKKILTSQRRYAYPIDALCKTCIVSMPLRWDPGFHSASVLPFFDELYLFHMKLADLDLQAELGAAIARRANEQHFQSYHSLPKDVFMKQMRDRLARHPILNGFEAFSSKAYFAAYLNKIVCKNRLFGITEFAHDAATVEIPVEFSGYL